MICMRERRRHRRRRTMRPWIVFGNSLVTDLSIWEAQAAALAGRYRHPALRSGGAWIVQASRAGTIDFDDLGDRPAGCDGCGGSRACDLCRAFDGRADRACRPSDSGRPLHRPGLLGRSGQDGPGRALQVGPNGSKGARDSGMDAFAAETAERWLTGTAGPDPRARLTR